MGILKFITSFIYSLRFHSTSAPDLGDGQKSTILEKTTGDSMANLDMLNGVSLKELLNQPNLSYWDKERILVRHTSTADMLQFTDLPYLIDKPIKRFIPEGTHPCAFMNLSSHNRQIVIRDLMLINDTIKNSHDLSRFVPAGIAIPTEEIVFNQTNSPKHTLLQCWPYSESGTISKRPLKLFFTTIDSLSMSGHDTSHGTLIYGVDGKIVSGDIYLWRNGNGYFFELRNAACLFVYRIKYSPKRRNSCEPETIYEDESIALYRAFQKQEHEKYEWIQRNLPTICPKSYSAYRRMKNQNTKNYQKIVEAAKQIGHDL